MVNEIVENEIIERFRNSVFWGKECEIFYHENRMLLKHLCPKLNIVFVPCHHENYMQGIASAIAIGSPYNLFPWVLMYGNADKERVGYLWHLAHTKWDKEIHVSWSVPSICSIYWNRMTNKALDGIDWVRSSENFANGSNTPVYTWDK